jgi:hypothetical protein
VNVASRLTRAFSANPSFFRLPRAALRADNGPSLALGYPYDQAILIQWLKEWDGRPARLFYFIRYGRDARATLCVLPQKHSGLASRARVYGAKREPINQCRRSHSATPELLQLLTSSLARHKARGCVWRVRFAG